MAGRPRLLTDDLAARAVELRRDGFAVEAIAGRLGVSKRTAQRALAIACGRDVVAEVAPMTPEAALVQRSSDRR